MPLSRLRLEPAFIALRIAALYLVLAVWACATQAQSAFQLTSDERAWVAAHPVVRVGVSTEFPPYYFSDGPGRYEGFVIDLMDRLARRAGLHLEYQRFDRFGDVLSALQRGDIDATPFVSQSNERERYLQFVRPLFSTQMVYVADRRLNDVDPASQFAGYRVAVERLSTSADLMRDKFPQAQVIEFDTVEQALLATAGGDADVFVGFRQVAVYFMEKHFTANLVMRGTMATPGTALGPAVRKELPELASILDKAISSMTTEEIASVAMHWLPRSVVGASPEARAELTEAQRTWVAQRGGVRLGFDAGFAPIAFTNVAGGFDGLAADITRAVARKAGLIVAYEEGGTFANVYERAVRGELDVIVAAARNADRSRHFDFVGPFLRVPTVVVAASDTDLGQGLEAGGRRRVALLKQHFLIPLLRSRYPSLQLIEFDSQAKALDAVRRKQADLAVGNMKVVNQILEAEHAGALRAIGVVADGDSELYFAVRNTQPELATVLRAALDAMSPAEMAEIENRWLKVQLSTGVPWARVLSIVGVILLLAAVALWVLWASNRRLRAAQRALEDARRVAEEQASARASFSAYLSHELRSALGGLANGLALINEGILAPPRQRVLSEALQSSAQGLLALCERTLDFERTLHGGIDLRPEPVRLHEVVERALAAYRVEAGVKGLALVVDCAFDPALRCELDAVRLTQVFHNLVGNAVKFTDSGEVRVTVKHDAASPQRLLIRVADTGPGIPADEQARLFEPFAQGSSGRLAGTGAGLGLSITASIVGAMQGTIEASAGEPVGTVFTVDLPLNLLA